MARSVQAQQLNRYILFFFQISTFLSLILQKLVVFTLIFLSQVGNNRCIVVPLICPPAPILHCTFVTNHPTFPRHSSPPVFVISFPRSPFHILSHSSLFSDSDFSIFTLFFQVSFRVATLPFFTNPLIS